MAIDKKLRIFDAQGNEQDYDIMATDVKFLPDGKDLPTKLAEMEQEIGEAGQVNLIIMNGQPYTPTNKVINLGTVITQHQDISGKVDKVPGKGLSTNDFTTALLNKLNGIATGAQVNVINGIKKHDGQALTPDSNGIVTLPEQTEVDLTDYYDKDEVDDAISQMQAQIEEDNLTIITGDRLSLWLDEDGESINIMAGEVPDIAATPTISHVINNDGTATVTIATTEQGATIYYTTNGDTPTESSSVYNSALTINTAGSHTIKAIAVIQDKMNSSVATDTFSVVSCQTPVIAVDNSDRNQAVVTATAGNDESVSLTVGGQTATGSGSASVTINKTSSSQTLSATATATATGKLSATATQNVAIGEQVAYIFGAHSIGGKAVAGTTQGDIKISTVSGFQNREATIITENGVVWWELSLATSGGGIALLQGSLYNQSNTSSSIFVDGGANVLTIEHIPEECTEIPDDKVLSACTAITKFKVAHQSALASCPNILKSKTNLTEVVLPSSVTVLNGTFDGCTALTSVYAPGVYRLTNAAFRSCAALSSLTLGTLTSLGANVFYECTGFDFDDVDFSSVTTIGENAFKTCTSLTSINIASATSIGEAAFRGCSALTSATFGSSLDTIGQYAFYGCKNFTSVDIPTVNSIGVDAFYSATPKTFTIRKEALSNADVPTVANRGLNDPQYVNKIYVPASSESYYEAVLTSYASKIDPITNS